MDDRELGAPNLLDLLVVLFKVIVASSAVVVHRGIAMDQEVDHVMNPPSVEGSSTAMRVKTDRRILEGSYRARVAVVTSSLASRAPSEGQVERLKRVNAGLPSPLLRLSGVFAPRAIPPLDGTDGPRVRGGVASAPFVTLIAGARRGSRGGGAPRGLIAGTRNVAGRPACDPPPARIRKKKLGVVGAPPEGKGRERMTKPARVFISYAREDEALRAELEDHLSGLKRSGHVLLWHDRMIQPGTDWAGVIDTKIKQADIFLLLVSARFIASNYCYEVEAQQALERHEAGTARVVPVIVSACDWTGTPFAHLEALPARAKAARAEPVTSWPNRDEAWASVASGLRTLVEGGKLDREEERKSKDERGVKSGWSAVAVGALALLGLSAVVLAFQFISSVETTGPGASTPLNVPVGSAPPPPLASGSGLPAMPTPPSASEARPPAVATAPRPRLNMDLSAPAVSVPPAASTPGTLPPAPPLRRSGTASLSGAFWSLGVPRQELGSAQFVFLDPSPFPEALRGVPPTCSLLPGTGMAQCSRSDKAQDVSLGKSVSWRLP